jgi:TonB family protein
MENPPNSLSGLRQYLIILPVVIALLAGLYFGVRHSRPFGNTRLPDVVGKTWAEATTLVRAAGCEPIADSVADARAIIVRQEPVAGFVEKGSQVILTTVLPSTPLPKIEGMSPANAERTIKMAGFTVGLVDTVYDSTQPVGKVAGSVPIDNAPEHSAVTILVSRGPEMVTLPDLVKMDYQQAVKAVGDAGFIIGDLTPKKSRNIKKIIEQKPTPGVYPKGTMVFLTIGVQSDRKQDTQENDGIVFPEAQTPPYPTKYYYPPYPDHLRKSGIQGEVIFDLEISSTGRITNFKLVKSLMPGRYGFDEIAFNAVYHWQFRPGTRGGKKAAGTVRVKIPFYLDPNKAPGRK